MRERAWRSSRCLNASTLTEPPLSWLRTTKTWQPRPDTTCTGATAGSWAAPHDRTARVAQHHLQAVALSTALFRLWRRRRGDDRAALDRRGDAVPGPQRKAGWRRVDNGPS